jgi:hypothetical protein
MTTVDAERPALPDPRVHGTLDVAWAAELADLPERTVYAQTKRYVETAGAEGIPAIKVGRSTRVLTRGLLEMLGLLDLAMVGGDA